MYRNLSLRTATIPSRRALTTSSSTTKQFLTAVLGATATTTLREFSSPSQPLLAFQSRSTPQNVVRSHQGQTNSNNTNTPSSASPSSSSSITPTASQVHPEVLNEWKRILSESLKAPTLELRREFLESFGSKFDNLDELLASKKLVFDSPFVQTLLYTTAALFPLPELNSSSSCFTRQDLVALAKKRRVPPAAVAAGTANQNSTTTSTSKSKSPDAVPPLVFKAIEWIVHKRQHPQALESATLSLDAAIASFCLVRLGVLGSFSPQLSSTYSSGYGAILAQNYNSIHNSGNNSSSPLILTSTSGTETARRLALQQREMRNLNPESLALSVFTCGCIGKSAQPAGEACLTKLGPLINSSPSSITFSQFALLASSLFDPANFSSAADRATLILRKGLLSKLQAIRTSSTTNIDQVAGTESAVIVSIISSLFRDPCFVEPEAATEILKQLCEVFLENDQLVASPRSVLELIRAFSENLVEKMGSSESTPGKFAQNPVVRKAVVKYCSKLTDEQLKKDHYCLTEIFGYLSLSSMRNFDDDVVPEFKEFSARIQQLVETYFVDVCVNDLLQSSLDCPSEAWAFADTLVSGLARIHHHHHRAQSSKNAAEEGEAEITTQEENSTSPLQRLTEALYKDLSKSASEKSLPTATIASRIAAILKSPGMIQKPELQRLISDAVSPHSSSLHDILIVLEGLTSSPFTVNTHAARQIARSLAPVAQINSTSSNNASSTIPGTTGSHHHHQAAPFLSSAAVSSPREDLLRVAHCYGLLRVREESLCQALTNKAVQLRDEFSAEDLGVMVFALARMDERNPKPYVDLAQRVRVVTAHASASAATSIIVAYARAAAVWNYTMYFRLCERIVELRATWKRRDMLPLLVALARLEMRHEKLIELVTFEVLKTNPKDLTTEECTRFLSVLTHFTPNSPAAPKLGQILVERQNDLSALQIGEALSSLGRAHVACGGNNNNSQTTTTTPEQETIRSVFDQLVLRTTVVAPSAPPMAIATILNGFVQLKYPHKEIFAVLGDRMLNIKNECPALVIGQVLHAFATLGLKDDRLFVEMIPRVRFVAHHGSPQDVANVLTAYTTVQLWHYKLFVRLAERAIAVRADCRPSHIAQILAAFAKVEMKYDKLFTELSPRIQVLSGSASATDVAMMIGAYAGVNLYDAPVFSQLADRAIQIATQFTGEEALTIIESFDKMSIQHEAVRKALASKADEQREKNKKNTTSIDESDENADEQQQEEKQEDVVEERSETSTTTTTTTN